MYRDTRAFGDVDAELEQFTMDAWGSPAVLCHHERNEFTQLSVGSWSSRLTGDAPPVGPIRSSVPGHDGCRCHDGQGGTPVRPHRPQRDPESAIDREQPRAPAAASGDGELLAEGEIVEHEGLSGEGQRANAPEDHFEHQEHRATMRDPLGNGKGNPLWAVCKLSILGSKRRGWDFGEAQLNAA